MAQTDFTCKPIGTVRHQSAEVPRHWSISEVEGELVINEALVEGLKDIQAGQRIVVLFHFHKSPPFGPDLLTQKPPHHESEKGVFSICSPVRPNPLGMSVLEVIEVRANVVRVKGLDMLDGTPILDIKPHVESARDCPSCGT